MLLPGLFTGSWQGRAILIALFPLAVLGIGIWRRIESILLLGFPSALLVPVAAAPEIVASYSALRFAMVAIGLIAYLFGASVFASFYEPVKPVSSRQLSSASKPQPVRWRRRFRVYHGLAILSVVFPAVILYAINFNDSNQAFMKQMFPGRAGSFAAVVNLAAIGVWVLMYSTFFLGTLRPHRTGDRDLVADLARLRRDARRAKPRPLFYVGVVAALAFMLLLLISQLK